MKGLKRGLTAILALLIVFAAMPINAFASGESVKIALGYSDIYGAEIKITSYSESYDTVRVEKSADKNSWSECTTEYTSSDSVEIDIAKKTALYYRVILTDSYEEITSAPSNAIQIKADISEVVSSSDMYDSATPSKSTLFWEIGKYSYKYIDGFLVYSSVNGGEYKKLKKITADKYYEKSSYAYKYKVAQKAPSKYGYMIRYKVYPYYIYNSKTYKYTSVSPVLSSSISKDCVSVTTKKDKVILKLKKLGKVKYKIKYQSYNIKKHKYSKTKTKKTSKTSVTFKNKAKTNALSFDIIPYIDSLKGEEIYDIFSHEGAALLRGAGKANKTKIPVLNVQKKKTTTEWNDSLTAKDKKIIKAFFKKKYGNKLPAREVMAEYALNWIHNKVKYDRERKSDNYTYTDAILNHRTGQCLQYNMTMAKILTYLGYETRILQGWRGDYPTKYWQHYWCEVKIHGRWFIVETGNIKDGGWMHFVELYENASGYLINTKPAKDK